MGDGLVITILIKYLDLLRTKKSLDFGHRVQQENSFLFSYGFSERWGRFCATKPVVSDWEM